MPEGVGKAEQTTEVPPDYTAREGLTAWMAELPEGTTYLFPSREAQQDGCDLTELTEFTFSGMFRLR